MNLIIKSIITSLFVLNSSLAFAGISEKGEESIKGKIVKFNEETATLYITVPRKAIPRHIKLMRGVEVSAIIEIQKIRRHLIKKPLANQHQNRKQKKNK